jgi:hypothetical protein
MQAKTRSTALTNLIKLRRKILDLWQTEDQILYPGVRFDSGEPEWRGGYGIPRDHDLPDFVKKDNEGWDYVARSKDE